MAFENAQQANATLVGGTPASEEKSVEGEKSVEEKRENTPAEEKETEDAAEEQETAEEAAAEEKKEE